jgi:hypothetical protein
VFYAGTPIPHDYLIDSSLGLVGGNSTMSKFGQNPDVDAAAEEDIWDGGGVWAAPTAARVHTLTGHANDTAAGTGAQTVQVQGLDASGDFQEETVTMNGAGGQATSGSYTMIHRMYVVTAGATGWNEGNILATAAVDATITARISIGNNQTLMAIYKIPASRTGLLHSLYFSVNKVIGVTPNAVDIKLKALPSGEVWQLKHVLTVDPAVTAYVQHRFLVLPTYAAGTILKISAATDVDNTNVAVGFDLLLQEV